MKDKKEKCFICGSELNGHAVLGTECDEIYYKNKMQEVAKDIQNESMMKQLRQY